MSKLSAAILASFSANRRRAYLVGPQDCTFAQLEADVAALAQFFALNQLDGKRVIVATQQDRALLTCFCAALLAGATAAILDPKAPTPELSALVNAADAGGMIADAEVLDRLASADGLRQVPVQIPVNRPAPARGSFRVFGDRKSAAEANDFAGVLAQHVGAKLQATDVDDEAIAYILFTSGTTSRPKGVTISHRALFAQMQTFIRNYGLDDRSRVMNLLPFHHTDGLTQGAMMCLLAGSTFVRPYAFTADILPQMLNDLYKHAVTHLVTVPSVLALTRTLESSFDGAFDYPEFRFVVSTAAFLEPSLWQSCEERFGIQVVNVYGLTETVCETLYSGPAPEHRRLGSVGKPIDSRAKIVDEEGRELGDGQIGELLVAGDHLMSGYFNNPEATAEVLQDGWFRTGDLARRDKDGFYFITGRKKDLIISGGLNIYPEDVNGVLRSIPGVIDAATFGLPDPMWGERAVSCVVCDDGADPSEEELVARCLAGDQDAWNDLVQNYSRYVFAICSQGYRLQGADAEDAFQDVFVRVYGRLGSLRNPEALRPWIAQLTRRVCLDRIAKGKREEPSDLDPAGIEGTIEELDEAFAVREALEELSEECQEVLDRFFCRDESYRTIGDRLELPSGTIASRISRCLVKLRGQFEGRNDGANPSGVR